MMLKTENIYMQDNNRRMPEIVDDLFFVIDEKLNSVELQDKGHEALSKRVSSFCRTWAVSWPISKKRISRATKKR